MAFWRLPARKVVPTVRFELQCGTLRGLLSVLLLVLGFQAGTRFALARGWMSRKRRLRFNIDLDELDAPDVSLKDLAKSKGVKLTSAGLSRSGTVGGLGGHDEAPRMPRERWQSHGNNIITELEKKYCGHAGVRSDEGEDMDVVASGAQGQEGTEAKKKRKRKALADDEYYDLDDPFIDDSELFEVFQKQEEAETTVTKYAGFFVNSGDLEVSAKVVKDEDVKEPKKRKKKKESGVQPSKGTSVGGATAGPSTALGRATSSVAAPAAAAGAVPVGGAAERHVPPVRDETYWPPNAEGEAALSKYREHVGQWRARGNVVDEGTTAALPRELEPALVELEVSMRGGTVSGVLLPGYLDALRGCLALTNPVWIKALKSAVRTKVEALEERITSTKATFAQHYAQKREIVDTKCQQAQQAAQQAGEGGAAPAPPGPKSMNVQMDGKLKHCIATLLANLKEVVMLKNLHPSEFGGVVLYDDDEEEVLLELAANWPSGAMKPARLRKAHETHLAKEKQKAEGAAKDGQAVNGTGRSSTPTTTALAPSATAGGPSGGGGGAAVPALKKKRSSGGGGGAKRKSLGPVATSVAGDSKKPAKSPRENGSVMNGGVKAKRVKTDENAKKVKGGKQNAAGKQPAQASRGPAFGPIDASGYSYNPDDFALET